MLTEFYIEALLVDEELADQAPGLWGDCEKAGEAAGVGTRPATWFYVGSVRVKQ